MSGYVWARLPSRWIQQRHGLAQFKPSGRPGDLGAKISGLKLYLAIIAKAGIPGREPPGSVALTYEELTSMADVSRGMVLSGLEKISHLVNMRKGIGRASNLYSINNFEKEGGGWAKLPVRVLEPLAGGIFSSRNRVSLGGLRLYLAILAFRNNSSNSTMLGYTKIMEYTGIARTAISPAISLLVEAGLVSVVRGEEGVIEHTGGRFNRYRVLGLERRSGSTSREASLPEGP